MTTRKRTREPEGMAPVPAAAAYAVAQSEPPPGVSDPAAVAAAAAALGVVMPASAPAEIIDDGIPKKLKSGKMKRKTKAGSDKTILNIMKAPLKRCRTKGCSLACFDVPLNVAYVATIRERYRSAYLDGGKPAAQAYLLSLLKGGGPPRAQDFFKGGGSGCPYCTSLGMEGLDVQHRYSKKGCPRYAEGEAKRIAGSNTGNSRYFLPALPECSEPNELQVHREFWAGVFCVGGSLVNKLIVARRAGTPVPPRKEGSGKHQMMSQRVKDALRNALKELPRNRRADGAEYIHAAGMSYAHLWRMACAELDPTFVAQCEELGFWPDLDRRRKSPPTEADFLNSSMGRKIPAPVSYTAARTFFGNYDLKFDAEA